jgi:hypothetical protein
VIALPLASKTLGTGSPLNRLDTTGTCRGDGSSRSRSMYCRSSKPVLGYRDISKKNRSNMSYPPLFRVEFELEL